MKMAKEYSPFTPGVPVPIEFFIGREKEITEVVTHVAKSASMKTLERIFITGERGIGKSSLCRMALRIAEEKHEVIGLHVFLGGVTSLEEMVRRVFERLLQESRDRNWFDGVKGFLGNHVKEVGLFGVSLAFEASERDLSQAVSDFGPTLRKLMSRIGQHRKGLVIVLDDLNGLAASGAFANWLKSLVDEIATAREAMPLTLILAGLPDRRRQLLDRQPSLDRVFDLITIRPFNEAETRQFYEQTLAKVNVSVTPDALHLLWRFSGGYPVFLHEIGDAVFKVDTDGKIDANDAIAGVMSAALIIGEKYIEPKVLDAIWSERYRGILKKIAEAPLALQFAKADLLKRISPEEAKVLNNFLQKMKQMGVIHQDPAMGRGQYRFTSELYAMFFWLQAAPEKKGPTRI
jgi:AAA+ ATPase superfamily predicted ATPase